jgi:LSD1 subclass zinc finger protein
MSDNPSLFSLECPNCNAPLEYDGHSSTIKCQFCHTSVAVPENLRDSSANRSSGREGFTISIQQNMVSTDKLDEIKSFLQDGNKVEAVRLYKEATGCSLKQAKIAMELMQAEMEGRALNTSDLVSQVPEVQIFQTADASQRAVKGIFAGVGMVTCLTIGSILFVLGGVLALIFLMPGGPLRPRMNAMAPAEMVSMAPDKIPDIVSQIYHPDDEVDKIIWVETNPKKTRWVSSPFSGDERAELMAVNGNLVYVASGAKLIALNDVDGSIAWQTRMTDKCVSYEDNLFVMGGRVIVMTIDGNLQAFDAQTGSPAWSRQMKGHDRKLRVSGDRLLILDFVLGNDSYFELVFLNPVDGSEQMVISPACFEGNDRDKAFSTEFFENNDGLVLDEAKNSLFLVYGSSPGCVQNYDLASGDLLWEKKQEINFDASFYDFAGINDQGRIFFNFENGLAFIDKLKDSWSVLMEQKNYELIPLTAMKDILVARVKKTSGSNIYEIWGIEVPSGQVKWKYNLDENRPLDPPYEGAGSVDKDSYVWTWRTVPQGFQVLKFQGEPNRLVIVTLNPADGTGTGETVIDLSKVVSDYFSTPTLIGWQDETLWIIAGSKIAAVDTTAGKVVFTWQ